MVTPTPPTATILPSIDRPSPPASSQPKPVVPPWAFSPPISSTALVPNGVAHVGTPPAGGPPPRPPRGLSPSATGLQTNTTFATPPAAPPNISGGPGQGSRPLKRALRPPPLDLPAAVAVANGTDLRPGSAGSAGETHRRTPVTPKRQAPPIPVQKSRGNVAQQQGSSPEKERSVCSSLKVSPKPIRKAGADNPNAAVSHSQRKDGRSNQVQNGNSTSTSRADGCMVNAEFQHQLSERLLLASGKENSSPKTAARALPRPPLRSDCVKQNTPTTAVSNGTAMTPPANGGIRNREVEPPRPPPKVTRFQKDTPLTNGHAGSAHLPMLAHEQFAPGTSSAGRDAHLDYSGLESCVWFWGPMSREDCEHRLHSEGVMGNIAVRVRGNKFVISCW